MEEKEIGKVTHYFGNIKVAAIEITAGGMAVGDRIRIKGATSDFTQTVGSMQIEHESVESAEPGDTVGIKVEEHARANDKVYKVVE